MDELKECGEVRLFVTSRYLDQKLSSREEKPKEFKKTSTPVIESPIFNDGPSQSLSFPHNSLGSINKPIHYGGHRPWPYPAHQDHPKFSAIGNSYGQFYPGGRMMLAQQQAGYPRRPVDGTNNVIVLDEDNEDKTG